jgi:hypothetical protein
MANYKTTTVDGTSYTRARSVRIANPLGTDSIIYFDEERVLTIGSETIFQPLSAVEEVFTPDTAPTVFPLLDATGEPTGAIATYMDVYLMLQSLYYYVAQQRDIAAAQPIEPEE